MREFGWRAATVAVDTWKPRLSGRSIVCHADHLQLALALAGDLRLPARRVIVDPKAPAPLTLAVASKRTGPPLLGVPPFWMHRGEVERVLP